MYYQQLPLTTTFRILSGILGKMPTTVIILHISLGKIPQNLFEFDTHLHLLVLLSMKLSDPLFRCLNLAPFSHASYITIKTISELNIYSLLLVNLRFLRIMCSSNNKLKLSGIIISVSNCIYR